MRGEAKAVGKQLKGRSLGTITDDSQMNVVKAATNDVECCDGFADTFAVNEARYADEVDVAPARRLRSRDKVVGRDSARNEMKTVSLKAIAL
jgi:hypothetical protein